MESLHVLFPLRRKRRLFLRLQPRHSGTLRLARLPPVLQKLGAGMRALLVFGSGCGVISAFLSPALPAQRPGALGIRLYTHVLLLLVCSDDGARWVWCGDVKVRLGEGGLRHCRYDGFSLGPVLELEANWILSASKADGGK